MSASPWRTIVAPSAVLETGLSSTTVMTQLMKTVSRKDYKATVLQDGETTIRFAAVLLYTTMAGCLTALHHQRHLFFQLDDQKRDGERHVKLRLLLGSVQRVLYNETHRIQSGLEHGRDQRRMDIEQYSDEPARGCKSGHRLVCRLCTFHRSI